MGSRCSHQEMASGGYPASSKISLDGQEDCRLSEATPVACVAQDNLLAELKIDIGTSAMVAKDSTLVRRVSNFSDKSEHEVRSRFSYGDAGYFGANRLMHVAFLNGIAVGWCSSSTRGCGGDGHWGALSVDPAAQGRGVASALVKAAERRLLDAGCRSIQIEYRFTVGDASKERLYAWYEDKLGFDGGPRRSGFRCCHKALSPESFEAQHMRRNPSLQGQLFADEASGGQQQEQHDSKRARGASSASSTSSSSPSPS